MIGLSAVRCRSCRPRRPPCPAGSAAPGRTAARRRRDSGWNACRPSQAISTTMVGSTKTVPGVRRTSQLEELLGLPGQHLVGESLERLAEHDQLTGRRIAGGQVQVGQPALAAAVSPFDRGDDQVEGVPRFDLDPGGVAATGRVRGGQVLDDHSLVAVRPPHRRRRSATSAGVAQTARGTEISAGKRLRHHRRAAPAAACPADRGRRRAAGRRSRPGAGWPGPARATSTLLIVRDATTWKASGRPSLRSESTSPSSTRLLLRQRPDHGDHLGQPGR